jgi:P4 family phage/plasmid primase-like protien
MKPNPNAALQFLNALDPNAKTFNLRSLVESANAIGQPKNYNNFPLSKITKLLEDCASRGHSLYVVVNEGGQQARYIRRIRALFIDLDRKEFASDSEFEIAVRRVMEGRLNDGEAAPDDWPQCSAVVRSGGGYHLYWFVDDCELPEFTSHQLSLALQYKGDPSCSDLPRIMRLPGSIHFKKDPFLVELSFCQRELRHTTAGLVSEFGLEAPVQRDHRPKEASSSRSSGASDPVLRWLEDHPEFLKPGGRCGPDAPVDVICPNVASGLVTHSQPDSATSTSYFPEGLNGKTRGFKCFHSHCVDLKLRSFLAHIGYETNCPPFETDDGLTCRFVEWLDGRAIFSRSTWYVWNGSFWKPGESTVKLLLKQFADETSRQVAAEDGILAGGGNAAAKRRLKAAYSLLSEARQAQILKGSATLLLVDADLLDCAPDLLNVPNGAVDLTNGILLRPDPTNYSTLSASVTYDPLAESPRWEIFLSEIFCNNTALIDYFQRFIGYCLTGHMREEVMVVGFGMGANGKSVLAEIVRQVFGSYAITADPSLILSARSTAGSATPETARLAAKRLCLLNESKAGDRLDDGMVKKLVSTEMMTARPLYKDPFEFKPTAKLFLRTNHRPAVRDDTEGMWRRIHLVPFAAFFSPDKRDIHLMKTLQAELPGILAWAVRGSIEWYKRGLQPPAVVREATDTYRGDQDLFGAWFQDRTEPGSFTSSAALLDDYVRYAGLRISPNPVEFANRLKSLGAEPRRMPDCRGYKLALRPAGHDGHDLV